MPLTGELTDLSLAELIEFFCNQRKTGRLMVEYPQAPAYFYLQSGSVVHASIGSLRGIEAVYYALTQSNASFKFSSSFEAPEHTINQPWASVVLEGLRRMDEGIKPRSPFTERSQPVIEEAAARDPERIAVTPPAEHATRQEESEVAKPAAEETPSIQSKRAAEHAVGPATQSKANIAELVAKVSALSDTEEADGSVDEPKNVLALPALPGLSGGFLSSTESASRFSQGPWKLAAIFAALVLIVGGIALPWYARGKGSKAANQPAPSQASETTASQPAATDTNSEPAASTEPPAADTPEQTSAADNSSDAADTARKEREARAREEARLKAKETMASQPAAPAAANSKQTAGNTGSKKVVVQVTYDENGRVTQATGNDPTALRIARQKRFPPGKAGSATVTIPIN